MQLQTLKDFRSLRENSFMTYFNPVMDNQISIYINLHDNVMIWRRFPHFLAFVKGVQRSLMDSLHKGPVIRNLMQGPKELFNKHSNDRLTWDAKTLRWWYCNVFTEWQPTVYNSPKLPFSGGRSWLIDMLTVPLKFNSPLAYRLMGYRKGRNIMIIELS